MLRRPPVSIELKLEDLAEYENYRREQELSKDQSKTSKTSQDTPNWSQGPKTKQEIYGRIGYVPPSTI